MTDSPDTEKTVQSLVEAAQDAGTFSFAEVAQGRGYPKDTVVLYMDEATAYQISKIDERLAEIRGEQKKILEPAEQFHLQGETERLNQERVKLHETLTESGHTFHLQGISDELRDDLVKSAREKIKPEYDSHKNFITGQVEKQEKDSPERDRLYTNMLWAAHITQIVAPDGRVDTAPGLAAAEGIRNLPRAQMVKFAQAVQKLVVAAEAFEGSTDATFPRPGIDVG